MAIAPWFSDASLAEGEKLSGKAVVMLLRHSSGVVFPESNVTATIIFKSSTTTTQGFAVKSAFCSCCGAAQKRPYCGHLAAAALVALVPLQERDGQPYPAPLLFAETMWYSLATHLFHHYNERPGQLVQNSDDTFSFNIGSGDDEKDLSITLPDRYELLFTSLHKKLRGGGELSDAVVNLHSDQQRLTSTVTEQALNNQGSFSMGQRQAASLMFLMMGLLATKLADGDIVFSDESGSFYLSSLGSASQYGFRLRLVSGTKSEVVLHALAGKLPNLVLLADEVFEFTKIRINDDGSLCCIPFLRLADGRIFRREELFSCSFGNLLYLSGEGLRQIRRQDGDVAIRPAKPAMTSLFDYAAPQPRVGTAFTIASQDVTVFLEQSHKALCCADNDIDPQLIDFKLHDKPDNLHVQSCTHDEQGWYYLAGYYGVGNRKVPLLELLQGSEKGLEYLPGSGLQLRNGSLSWFYELGRERFWQQGGTDAGIKLTSLELLRLTSQIDDVILPTEGEDDRLASLLDSSHWQDTVNLPAYPEHLRDYQVNGLAWLYALYRHGLGGILADDMGLGKTHQALALIWLITRSEPDACFLVVCPATVASHWQMKAAEFYNDLRLQIYHGSGRSFMPDAQIVITTYGLLSRDTELHQRHFTAIFFDEMQHLKNKKTQAHQSALTLDSSCRIGLTGTPIENSSFDLKNLLNICLPGILGSDKQFKQRYGKGASPEQLQELAKRLSPFILRRDRQQVLQELPDIIDDTHTCELHEDQVAFYRQALGEQGKELRVALDDTNSKVNYIDVLAMVTRLKQICNHPNLLHDDAEYNSGKWDLFVELLDECLAAKMKVVVFSQYTSMLDIIEKYLHNSQVRYAGLRGSMPLKKRAAMIDRFQNEPDCQVFCASLLAGGVGVDLTAAQAVIHYDRWWNAAREDQATARVHRMGQKKVVQVFRLITTGTLEEKIHRIIEQRRELAAQLIKNDDAAMVKSLSRQDLRELLDWSGGD